jgi:glycosyltransferase-like protein
VTRSLEVALLTYSVKPRGGPVHTLAVAEALAARGHRPHVFAIAPPGQGFFRASRVPATVIDFEHPAVDFDERIPAMIEAYREGLREPLGAGFDVVHAQDCLSANSALDLREEGVIESLVRTVHHVDDFTSPSLVACQDRSILAPDEVLCVSAPWRERLRAEFGVEAQPVGNGVDRARFRPAPDGEARSRDRAAHGAAGRLLILTVGGIEPRKGSMTLIEAFAALREARPDLDPVLVVAGGATLFDYRPYRARVLQRIEALGLDLERDLRLAGPLPDAEIARLYRAADVFAFPSIKEGFGLTVLEAASAGLPVVASDIDVFRTFLRHRESALLPPSGDAAALAAALTEVADDPALRSRLVAGGETLARAHGWERVAERHEELYLGFAPVAAAA